MKDYLDLEECRFVTEIEVRTALVCHLAREARSKNYILAVEAVYGFENRRADLLALGDHSHAYEIKSDYDNTTRLPGQLAEYSKTFDFVTVATTPKHLSHVRKIAPKRVGLMVFDGQSIKSIRKPLVNKQLSKSHLASGTTKSRLLNALYGSLRNSSAFEVRAQAVKLLTTKTLRSLFLSELTERFSQSSAAFFSETDTKIAAEDLLLLRRYSRLFF